GIATKHGGSLLTAQQIVELLLDPTQGAAITCNDAGELATDVSLRIVPLQLALEVDTCDATDLLLLLGGEPAWKHHPAAFRIGRAVGHGLADTQGLRQQCGRGLPVAQLLRSNRNPVCLVAQGERNSIAVVECAATGGQRHTLALLIERLAGPRIVVQHLELKGAAEYSRAREQEGTEEKPATHPIRGPSSAIAWGRAAGSHGASSASAFASASGVPGAATAGRNTISSPTARCIPSRSPATRTMRARLRRVAMLRPRSTTSVRAAAFRVSRSRRARSSSRPRVCRQVTMKRDARMRASQPTERIQPGTRRGRRCAPSATGRRRFRGLMHASRPACARCASAGCVQSPRGSL